MLNFKSLFQRLVYLFIFISGSFGSFSHIALAKGEGVELMGNIPLYPSPDTVGVRALGMAGAGTALAEGTSSLFLNPAGLKRSLPIYVVEGAFSFHPSADSRIWNVSIVDTAKSNPLIGAGFSYSFFQNPREDDGKDQLLEGHAFRFALAMAWQNKLSIGLSMKYLHLSRPFLENLSAFTLDIGLIWHLLPKVALSIVGYNLIENPSNEIPLAMAIGVAVGENSPFRFAVDWIVDFESKGEPGHEFRIGAEYTFAKLLTLRLGYHYDLVRDRQPPAPWLPEKSRIGGHFLTGGIGIRYAQMGLQIAYRQQLDTGSLSNNRYLGFALQAWL